ncbi:MAG: hypothetical protein Q4G35_00160 [Propionibacteriaceae bacterium]|nr:hypothetical protein [Propionibacteriaceae bacterium]
MLENVGDRIQLTLPLEGTMGRESPYWRWFVGSAHVGDDPNRTKFSYLPPEHMLYLDHNGPVGLVRSRVLGASFSNFAGVGRLTADFAVLGATHLRYSKINGLRTELPALASWTDLSSVSMEPISNPEGRHLGWDVFLRSPENIRLSRSLNLSLSPSWATENAGHGRSVSVLDRFAITTHRKRPADWGDHPGLHRHIRDLLSISAWRPLGFSRIEVQRLDDPERAMAGNKLGDAWNQVVTSRLPMGSEEPASFDYLFRFSDIGTKGVAAWLRLIKDYHRAMGPLVALLDQKDAYLETRLVQSCIALEALGYQLALEAGRISGRRKREVTYLRALKEIQQNLVVSPLANWKDWQARSNDCYRGTKHPDNDLPDTADQLRTYRENLLVLRYWVAGRLGVGADQLRKEADRGR